MLGRRIAEIVRLETQLGRCVRSIDAMGGRSKPSRTIADTNRTFHPTQTLDKQHAGSTDRKEDVAIAAAVKLEALQSTRYKMLSRQVPIALSRLERCLVVPKRRRAAKGASAHVLPPQGTLPTTASSLPVETGTTLVVPAAPTPAKPVDRLHHLVVAEGLQEPKGPWWPPSSAFGQIAAAPPDRRCSAARPVAHQVAFRLLRAIHFFEQERTSLHASRHRALLKSMKGAERDIANRSAALQKKQQKLVGDPVLEDQMARKLRIHAALASLDGSLLARPYLSAFLWKALLQPEFIGSALGGLEVPPFGDESVPSTSSTVDPDVAVQSSVALCRLTLGVIASSKALNAMSPRFVVSLRRLVDAPHDEEDRHDEGAAEGTPLIRCLPSKPSVDIVPLVWLNVHCLSAFLASLMRSPAQHDAVQAAKHESNLVQQVVPLSELLQSLQMLCSAIILLDGHSVARDAKKRALLHSAENGLLAAASFVVAHATTCAQAIRPDQACRLLTTLFRLQSIRPDKASNQLAVVALMVRLFPILSNNTFAQLSTKLQNSGPSMFGLLTKKHRAKLRRVHGATTSSAVAAVLANTVAEHRLQSRHMVETLRQRRMTEHYSQNVAVLDRHSVDSIALVFQIACMTASAANAPPQVAHRLVGAACLAGEALLNKLSAQDARHPDALPSASDMERLTTLVMATTALLPVTQSVSGLLPRKGVRISGESYFASQFLVYLLRGVASILARCLASMEGGKPDEVVTVVSLRHVVFVCDALHDVHGQRTDGTLKEQMAETLHLVKAYLGAVRTSWWHAGCAGVGEETLQGWRASIVAGLSAHGSVDPSTDDLLHKMLRASPVVGLGDDQQVLSHPK